MTLYRLRGRVYQLDSPKAAAAKGQYYGSPYYGNPYFGVSYFG